MLPLETRAYQDFPYVTPSRTLLRFPVNYCEKTSTYYAPFGTLLLCVGYRRRDGVRPRCDASKLALMYSEVDGRGGYRTHVRTDAVLAATAEGKIDSANRDAGYPAAHFRRFYERVVLPSLSPSTKDAGEFFLSPESILRKTDEFYSLEYREVRKMLHAYAGDGIPVSLTQTLEDESWLGK